MKSNDALIEYLNVPLKIINSVRRRTQKLTMQFSNIILGFFIISFSSSEGAECFGHGYSWTNEYILAIFVNVPSSEECLDSCIATKDCLAFSYFNEGPNFAETCKLFSDIGKQTTCSDCTSGRIIDCQPCSEPVACEITDANLISDLETDTEFECWRTCKATTSCVYYTWFDDSTFLKNRCFLLSTCGETQGCTGCISGPANCKTKYCEGIEYRELDDPTRNENHGN